MMKLDRIFSKCLAIIFVAILYEGCERKDLTTEFVLPPSYHGYIFLVEDLQHGSNIAVEDHKVRVVVPTNGIVFVQDTKFLEHWFKLSATDYNGKRIQTETEDNADPNRPALSFLSSGASQHGEDKLTYTVFMVGTVIERRNYTDNTVEHKHAIEELRAKLSHMKQ